MSRKTDLSVKIGRLKLKNPVMAASGTFGYAEEFADFMDLSQLGAIVTKTITLKARQGNPPPRTCEAPAGLINSIGLENPGIEAFIKDKLPFLKKLGVPVIVSIASEDDPEEFVELARRLEKIEAASALELNISCPNIKDTRTQSHKDTKSQGESKALISQDARATYDLVRKVRKVTRKTLITKLSPNVTDITEIACAAQEGGSDAVSLINTLASLAIDLNSRKPKLAAVTGGLSGPGIRPIALRMVWEVYKKINIPIIGMGGIIDAFSALEFFIAGSRAINVGTANFVNPKVCLEIIQGIKDYLAENKIRAITELTGILNVG